MFKVVGGRRANPPLPISRATAVPSPKGFTPGLRLPTAPCAFGPRHGGAACTGLNSSPCVCLSHVKKQAPFPAEGPTRAEPAGFFDASRELQGRHSQPGAKPAAVACSEGLQDLASYFLRYALTQIRVHLLYVRTLRLDLTSIAFKCFIYFPENRQFCSRRTQGEIPTSLKALRVCH